MSCSDIREKISAYIDNELPPEGRTEVEVHLALCQECSLYLEELRNTVSAAKSVEEIEPPAWLAQKVMARVKEEAEGKRGFLHKLFLPLQIKLPLQAFATIAVVITAFFVFKAVQPELHRAKTTAIHPQEEAEVIADEALEGVPALSSERELMQEKRQIQPMEGSGADTYEFAPSAPASDRGEPIFLEEQKIMSPALMKDEAVPSVDLYRADEAEPEGLSDAFKLKGAPAKKQDDAVLTLGISIYRIDVETARSEIEEIVKEFKAEIVRIESFETNTVFTVKIDSARLLDLHNRLIPAGGRLTEGSIETEGLNGYVEVEIEVLTNN
jgi:hypothetical protein